MKWAPLGPRRAAGRNPRARGTDPRSRLTAARQLGYPTNERFALAALAAARAPLGPPEAPQGPTAHPRAPQALRPGPKSLTSDSDWRRRAVATGGPCALCTDDGVYLTELGAVICTERVTPRDSITGP